MTLLRKSVLLFGFFVLCMQGYAQDTQGHKQDTERVVITKMPDGGAFSILERSDWRRYDNGKYIGLVRNEVRASIIPFNGGLYQGNFFVLQSTLRDMRHSAQAVDAIVPVRFEVTGEGSLEIESDRGFPMLRGFPFYPDNFTARGARWSAQGDRAVDPFNKGQAMVIPFTANYEYRGIENYNGVPVHRLYAAYGYNYQNEAEAHPYLHAIGNHKVDILIRASDSLVVFMRDDLDVTYTLSGRSKIQFRGFTLTFASSIVPLDKEKEITSLEKNFVIEAPGIDFAPVDEGIKLTVKDIRFIADSSEFLPEESPRLDLLAQALKQIPDRTFLVEGHTASVGLPENEMKLSIERAESIISELVKRGIKAERFIFKGWGGTRPVSNNTTNEGRSANRRVEITILE